MSSEERAELVIFMKSVTCGEAGELEFSELPSPTPWEFCVWAPSVISCLRKEIHEIQRRNERVESLPNCILMRRVLTRPSPSCPPRQEIPIFPSYPSISAPQVPIHRIAIICGERASQPFLYLVPQSFKYLVEKDPPNIKLHSIEIISHFKPAYCICGELATRDCESNLLP